MPYCQLFYHCVWATKNRQPLITPAVEPLLYGYIRSKAIGLGGTVFALNGVEDHTHLVTTIPPSIAVASFIGQVKGVSSAHLNKGRGLGDNRFEWQDEYGVFSFDGKRLPNVIAYVENQKQHHTQHSTIPLLERMDGEAIYVTRETPALYVVESALWREEMLALSRLDCPTAVPQ